ncbi:MAG: tetratricopeptide repeat protein [Thermoplasmatales archaeon]|nr:tetratricopeptide repeat protein [Thermoplasmatales archaeon]
MGGNETFSNVGANIAKGNIDAAVAEILTIAESSPDVGTLLSCASILKAIGEADGFDRVVALVMDASEGGPDPYETASSLSGLGLYAEALTVLEGTEDPAAIPTLYATALLEAGRAGEAVEVLSSDGGLGLEGSITLSEALCAVGRHDEAISLAESLIAEGGWPAMRAYCGAMMHKGDNRGAFKYARKAAKGAGAADSNALAAYVMRINGRVPAAAAYAARALKADPHHVGALEEMAMCLLEKGEVDRARYFAGAINEASPGHPAAMRILDACLPR